MKSFHPAIKILTAIVFVVLMSGFVAFKSGAFDGARSARLKLHVSKTGLSHHRKSNDPNKRTLYKERPPLTEEQDRAMMHSSKTIVGTFTLTDFKNLHITPTMMSSSKFAVLAEPSFPNALYQAAFTRTWPKKKKHSGGELRQGRK